MEKPVSSRIVIATNAGRRLVLDCTLLSSDRKRSAGSPFTLEVRPPGRGWIGRHVTDLLYGWADADSRLEMEIGSQPRRVTVSDGRSKVRLDLEAAYGLTRWPPPPLA